MHLTVFACMHVLLALLNDNALQVCNSTGFKICIIFAIFKNIQEQ